MAIDTIQLNSKPSASDYRDPDSGKHPVIIEVPNGWAAINPGTDMKNSGKLLERGGRYYTEDDVALIYQDGKYRITGS